MNDKASMDIAEYILDKKSLEELSTSLVVQKETETDLYITKQEIDDSLHFVGFEFGEEEYIIEIHLIREIIMVANITPVPHVADFFEGVINLRGNIVPVINLRLKLEMPNKEMDTDSRIIIIEFGEMVVGYLVDKITKVIRLPKAHIEPATSSFGEISEEFMKGIGRLEDEENIVGWLDVYKIIESEIEEVDQEA